MRGNEIDKSYHDVETAAAAQAQQRAELRVHVCQDDQSTVCPEIAAEIRQRWAALELLEELKAARIPHFKIRVCEPEERELFPRDAAGRKAIPVASGVLDYFPAALCAVAEVSKAGNDQHNPGEPLHWARGKSMDQADTIIRHFMERGSLDHDGFRHSAKLAWRALALLQLELEAAGYPKARGAK